MLFAPGAIAKWNFIRAEAREVSPGRTRYAINYYVSETGGWPHAANVGGKSAGRSARDRRNYRSNIGVVGSVGIRTEFGGGLVLGESDRNKSCALRGAVNKLAPAARKVRVRFLAL